MYGQNATMKNSEETLINPVVNGEGRHKNKKSITNNLKGSRTNARGYFKFNTN
jgi:hypothetical protein